MLIPKNRGYSIKRNYIVFTRDDLVNLFCLSREDAESLIRALWKFGVLENKSPSTLPLKFKFRSNKFTDLEKYAYYYSKNQRRVK